jgi:hypothetical protein
MSAFLRTSPSLMGLLGLMAVASPAAFAQENVDTATEKKVTPYGLLGLNTHFLDSSKENPLNFENAYARFGLKVKEGIAVGQLELDPFATTVGDTVGLGTLAFRHANVGVKLETGTTVLFGRYRIGGANGYGADKTYVPDQFSSMDGISVNQELEFGEGVKLALGLAVSNGLLSVGATEGVYGTDGGGRFNRFDAAGSPTPVVGAAKNRVFGEKSFKTDRALTFSLVADIKGVAVAAYHGFEANQYVREGKDPKAVLKIDPADATKTTSEVTAAVPAGVADAAHTEVSVGYTAIEGISFGGWYVLQTQEKTRDVTGNEGGKLKTEAKPGFSVSRTVIGAGVMGDSSLFGVVDLLQKGDKLIYSASFANTSWDVSGDNVNAVEGKFVKSLKDSAADAETNQIVVGGGYAVGGLSFELNIAQETAKGKIFANSKGETGKSDSQTNVYLASNYAF